MLRWFSSYFSKSCGIFGLFKSFIRSCISPSCHPFACLVLSDFISFLFISVFFSLLSFHLIVYLFDTPFVWEKDQRKRLQAAQMTHTNLSLLNEFTFYGGVTDYLLYIARTILWFIVTKNLWFFIENNKL